MIQDAIRAKRLKYSRRLVEHGPSPRLAGLQLQAKGEVREISWLEQTKSDSRIVLRKEPATCAELPEPASVPSPWHQLITDIPSWRWKKIVDSTILKPPRSGEVAKTPLPEVDS